MVVEELQSYLLGAVFGFALGALIIRLLFRSSIRKRKISDAIEFAMIDKTVSQLNSMTTILNRLVADIKTATDELTERIELAQDLEPIIEIPKRTENNKDKELSDI